MRPDTRRRTAVLAVCLAGVVALYWVPTAVRSPERLGVPAAPGGLPTVVPVSPSAAPDPTSSTGSSGRATTPDPDGSAREEGPDDTADPPPAERSTDRPPTRDRSTPEPTREGTSDPAPSATSSPRPAPTTRSPVPTPSATSTDRAPGPVPDLHLVAADYEGLTVGWAPASAAVRYTVWLNGYQVGGTTGTEVALRWFNDDMSEHFVQVRPVGADGQPGPDAAFLRVSRPGSPSPEPTPSSGPTPSPGPSTPAPTPSPSGAPDSASPSASAEPDAASPAASR